jgi:hypothetical protein
MKLLFPTALLKAFALHVTMECLLYIMILLCSFDESLSPFI